MKIIQNAESSFTKKLYVGTGEVKVLAVNPTQKELDKILNREYSEDREEIEYTKDVEAKYTLDGEEETINTTRLFVDFWVQEVTTDVITKIRFMLTNVPRYNKEGTKQQYINQIGQTAWANVDDESSLADWFTKFTIKDKFTKEITSTIDKTFRPCMRGEDELYEFLTKWSNLNIWDSNSYILVDNIKKFWKGNMSEIEPLIPMLEDRTVLGQFGVRSVLKTNDDGEEETIEYQSIFTKSFAPGSSIKDFKFHQQTGFRNLEKAKYAYDLKKFISSIFEGEYGFKDYTVKDYFQEYNPDDNVLNSESAVTSSQSSMSY